MSTVPQTSDHRTASDDAPRADRAARDEVAPPKPATRMPDKGDAPLDNPYEDMACTD
jgi:hypothetical protein